MDLIFLTLLALVAFSFSRKDGSVGFSNPLASLWPIPTFVYYCFRAAVHNLSACHDAHGSKIAEPCECLTHWSMGNSRDDGASLFLFTLVPTALIAATIFQSFPTSFADAHPLVHWYPLRCLPGHLFRYIVSFCTRLWNSTLAEPLRDICTLAYVAWMEAVYPMLPGPPQVLFRLRVFTLDAYLTLFQYSYSTACLLVLWLLCLALMFGSAALSLGYAQTTLFNDWVTLFWNAMDMLILVLVILRTLYVPFETHRVDAAGQPPDPPPEPRRTRAMRASVEDVDDEGEPVPAQPREPVCDSGPQRASIHLQHAFGSSSSPRVPAKSRGQVNLPSGPSAQREPAPVPQPDPAPTIKPHQPLRELRHTPLFFASSELPSYRQPKPRATRISTPQQEPTPNTRVEQPPAPERGPHMLFQGEQKPFYRQLREPPMPFPHLEKLDIRIAVGRNRILPSLQDQKRSFRSDAATVRAEAMNGYKRTPDYVMATDPDVLQTVGLAQARLRVNQKASRGTTSTATQTDQHIVLPNDTQAKIPALPRLTTQIRRDASQTTSTVFQSSNPTNTAHPTINDLADSGDGGLGAARFSLPTGPYAFPRSIPLTRNLTPPASPNVILPLPDSPSSQSRSQPKSPYQQPASNSAADTPEVSWEQSSDELYPNLFANEANTTQQARAEELLSHLHTLSSPITVETLMSQALTNTATAADQSAYNNNNDDADTATNDDGALITAQIRALFATERPVPARPTEAQLRKLAYLFHRKLVEIGLRRLLVFLESRQPAGCRILTEQLVDPRMLDRPPRPTRSSVGIKLEDTVAWKLALCCAGVLDWLEPVEPRQPWTRSDDLNFFGGSVQERCLLLDEEV
ncbi:hypothetical protein MPH_11299 [Macrophomina phaseolina MS6]|uniref:Uncharacterized protein n=1 Tax=Macrophomina phaseolina (strain MS6) TaxID=1126212 RepID=K2RB77_MACPH|nr:hypothetical protein MPH_11299 [Macrophomina phaseolina MS6]